MATEVRKQVYIEPRQDLILKRVAKEQGVTEAEIVRRATDRHTRVLRFPRRHLAAWEAERAYLQRLMEQRAVRRKRAWSREDLRER